MQHLTKPFWEASTWTLQNMRGTCNWKILRLKSQFSSTWKPLNTYTCYFKLKITTMIWNLSLPGTKTGIQTRDSSSKQVCTKTTCLLTWCCTSTREKWTEATQVTQWMRLSNGDRGRPMFERNVFSPGPTLNLCSNWKPPIPFSSTSRRIFNYFRTRNQMAQVPWHQRFATSDSLSLRYNMSITFKFFTHLNSCKLSAKTNERTYNPTNKVAELFFSFPE